MRRVRTTRAATTQVRRYVGKHRRDHRETFIPLAHDPGQRLECDFGHIHVDFPDGRRLVPVLVAAWAYSNYAFALAMPTERTEAILAGMVAAFEFFGYVPREVWWDNPKTVVSQIFKGRERRPNEYYAALASHYAFEALYLHAGARQREAACRDACAGAATAVGHAGAALVPTWTRSMSTCGSAVSRSPSAPWPATRSRSANASHTTRPRPCRCRRIGSMPA